MYVPRIFLGRPAYYSLFGLIVISILSVLVNTFISRIHPHPEDKVHPITEVVVVAAGGERGGALGNESSEDPPVARLVMSTPVKVSSVAPLQSSASSASSNVSRAALSPPSLAPSSSLESSSPYASAPPVHYQTPAAAQQSLNSRSSDSKR